MNLPRDQKPIDFTRLFGSDDGWADGLFRLNVRDEEAIRIPPMTVGIAVLCEGGKSVVMVSDRLVAIGIQSLQVDTDCIKTQILPNGSLLAFTGVLPDQDAIFRRLGGLPDGPFLEMIERIRSACEDFRHEGVDRELRKIGINLKAVGEAVLNQGVKNPLIADLLGRSLVGGFLVAGTDSSKCHIYAVTDVLSTHHDDAGFAAIGAGQAASLTLLAARGAHKGLSLEGALCIAYEAKRFAETTSGVGRQTDMAIVGVERPARFLPGSFIDELEGIYDARNRLSNEHGAVISRLLQTHAHKSSGSDSGDGGVGVDGESDSSPQNVELTSSS